MRISRALLTVSDKTGLDHFVQRMTALLPEIEWVATDGTQQFLSEQLPEIRVRNVTEFIQVPPEQNLVKTLDIRIFSGILLNDPPSDALKIDLLVSIPYPFPRVVTVATAFDEAISLIDIGGIALLRAAAKNHRRVLAISSPDQYSLVLKELSAKKSINLRVRRRMASEIFQQSSRYDASIAKYLRKGDV